MVNYLRSSVCDMLLLKYVSFYVLKLLSTFIPNLSLVLIGWKSYPYELSVGLTCLVVTYHYHLCCILLVEDWAVYHCII